MQQREINQIMYKTMIKNEERERMQKEIKDLTNINENVVAKN